MKSKKIIKNYLMLGGALLLFFTSCQKENYEDDIIEASEKPVETVGQKAIIYNGQTFHAGYGYDPVRDVNYGVAIDQDNFIASFDSRFDNSVDISVFETKRELSQTFAKTKNGKASFVIPLFGLDSILGYNSDRTKGAENTIKFNGNTVAVVARVFAETGTSSIDESPTLTPDAQNRLARARDGNDPYTFDNFIGDYGITYINKNTFGGEIYYVYSFEYRESLNVSKETYKKNVGGFIAKIFGGGSTTTTEELTQETIMSTLTNSSTFTTVTGFPIQLLDGGLAQSGFIGQVNAQTKALSDYLRQYPQNAQTLAAELTPYSAFIGDAGLINAINRRKQCWINQVGWEYLRDEIQFIYEATKPYFKDGNINNIDPDNKNIFSSQNLRNQAAVALTNIDTQIGRSKTCNGSVAPSRGTYANLKDHWNLIKESRPLYRYRYDFNGAVDNMYTRNHAEMGGGNYGYALVGESGRVFTTNRAGTKPLYRYWNPDLHDHFYTTNYNQLGQGAHGWRLEGIDCYILNNPINAVTVPLIKFFNPINNKRADHLLWAGNSYSEPGYVQQETLGHVIAN